MSKLRETGFYYLITINYCEVRIFLLRKLLIKYLTYLQPSHHQKVFSLTKVRSGPCQNMSLAFNGSWSQNASRNAQMNLQGIVMVVVLCCYCLLGSVIQTWCLTVWGRNIYRMLAASILHMYHPYCSNYNALLHGVIRQHFKGFISILNLLFHFPKPLCPQIYHLLDDVCMWVPIYLPCVSYICIYLRHESKRFLLLNWQARNTYSSS